MELENIRLYGYIKYLKEREKVKKRESNLELLRILAMLLIVLGHYVYWGIGDLKTDSFINDLIFNFLVLGGKIGVNIFVFISSWFLVDSKFNLKKIIDLFLKVKIYAFIFLIIAILLKESLSLKKIIISLFPIIFKNYWFITCYMMLYIIFPYLNIMLYRITKNELKSLLMVLLLIFCFLQTFIGTRLFYSEFIWFIILYFITFYLKKYCILRNKEFFKKISIIIYMFIFIGSYIFKYFNLRFSLAGEYTITGLLVSVTIFCYFLQLNLGYKKYINFVSLGTLSVYLIHENIFGRDIIWNKILKTSEVVNFNLGLVIIHIIVSTLLIFIFGILTDKIINFLLNNIFNRKIESLILFLERKKLNFWNKVVKFTEKFEKVEM